MIPENVYENNRFELIFDELDNECILKNIWDGKNKSKFFILEKLIF